MQCFSVDKERGVNRIRVAEPELELEPEPDLFGSSTAGAVNLLRLWLRTKLEK